MNVLVTGGAGFIGSHAVKRLLAEGHGVLSIDSIIPGRGNEGSIAALRRWAGQRADRLWHVRGDVRDAALVAAAIRQHKVTAVMHFAALAYVGESVEKPLDYHLNNTPAMLGVLAACAQTAVDRFVFSSSCAVYGEPTPQNIPIREDSPHAPVNPYGWTKSHGERMLLDVAGEFDRAHRPFACCSLRYFNAAGSDPEGVVGEFHDPETHLIPTVLRAAAGLRGPLSIHGTDYPTPDGTCVRDYVHVEDIVAAHVLALGALDPARRDRWAYNLGVGRGFSVREVIDVCRKVTGRDVPFVEGPRRPGDPPTLVADASLIARRLGWTPRHTDVAEMAAHAWAWLRDHPRGYGG